MASVNIPLEDIARVAHQNAKSANLVEVRDVRDNGLATTLSNLATTEVTSNVESGEYVGKGTVQIEGTVEVNGTPVSFELSYWFEDDGGAKATFYPS